MEMVYDRLSNHATAGFKDSHSPVFRGVAKPRRSNTRSVLGHVLTKSDDTDHVQQLLERCPKLDRRPRIVGIDLTGSEKRATGWALMDGPKATTKSISTDADLIAETLAAQPDIVSIDSPLSLPEPQGAAATPIYRKCELALKRMGISVFWCLLPSMKMLTHRGIKLARELRSAGCNVIESYPGAAQDILGIPRKKASLQELKWGLSRAGITGDFLTASITHDEVDAITSALVGLFYLANDYIALGTPVEEYLIVPRSPKFNYGKLAQIVSASGLDHVSVTSELEVECAVHGQPLAPAAG
jgi:predicted nuclease with RNAse H fold